MKKLLFILYVLAITTPAYADYLGCFEPNEAVEIKTLYLNSTGVLTDPTSPACDILDPNDTTLTACTSGPTKVGTLTGIYESSYTIPASPLEGVWIVKQKGTVDSVVKDAADYFMVVDVAGECPGRAGIILKSATHTGAVIPTVTVVTNAVTLPTIPADWITAAGIAASAITSSEAPNLDAAVSTRSTFNVATDAVDLDFTLACPGTPTAGTVGDMCKTDADSTAQTGDSFARIGVAGAGLTNIDLPDQTMNITGNLSGSVGSVTGSVGSVTGAVGSVTGAVGSVTGNVGGNVVGSVASVTNIVTANTTQISGDSVAADNVEAAYDGTGYMGSGIAVSPTTDADTSGNLWRTIEITETGIITANDDHVGKYLWCGKEFSEIMKTVQGVTDTITVDPAEPFGTAQTSGACYIK